MKTINYGIMQYQEYNMEEPLEYNAGKKGEERIAVVKWNTTFDLCPVPSELQCGGAKSCKDCKVGMTRSEAIRKMARALDYEIGNGTDILIHPEAYAEAAFDALLER